jgi:hypothetical protein
MNHCYRPRVSAARLLVAALLLVPAYAAAAPVSCRTLDPCMVGVCLEDGTCDASPGNNGGACDTFNSCTVGTCSQGNCVESNRSNGASCDTADPCMQKSGQCSSGVCESSPLSNGSTCRADVMGPCVTGTCMTISTVTFCSPVFKCEQANACDLNCNPDTGDCESFPTRICDDWCSTATCTPDGDFGYDCSNVMNKPDNSSCDDPAVCNGKCESGTCAGSGGSTGDVCGDGSVDGAEECDDGDASFSPGESCDADCTLIPCGKPTNSSGAAPKASDALFVLKAAVQTVTCDLLVCDVNDSGSVTASDALLTLKKAVGAAVTLNCPEA